MTLNRSQLNIAISQECPRIIVSVNTEKIMDEHSYSRVITDFQVDDPVTANVGDKADQVEQPMDYSLDNQFDSTKYLLVSIFIYIFKCLHGKCFLAHWIFRKLNIFTLQQLVLLSIKENQWTALWLSTRLVSQKGQGKYSARTSYLPIVKLRISESRENSARTSYLQEREVKECMLFFYTL